MSFNSLFAWLIKKRIHQIDLFRKYPLDVQAELLEKLITAAKNTEYGKNYQFAAISNYTAFREKVPLNDYDTLLPFIERMMEGEQNVLWGTEIKWFAKSSGTTATRSKYIPVSKASIEDCHYKGGKDLLALYYQHHPEAKLYKGKHLIVGGSVAINSITEKSFSGDLSAIIVQGLPWWAERKRTPARSIAMLSEWEEKLEKMALSTLHEDVCIIAGVPSWTLLLLQRVLDLSGKKSLKEVWPNLELYMHGGVNFAPYRSAFEQLIQFDEMNYVETYNASEGFFGIQDELNSDELLLMLDYGIFYEFIPMEHFEGIQSKKVIDLSEVEVGKNYAVVISTNGGLWRYILGDTIRFTSTLPFRFKISGRTKHYINTFGEELIVENTENALSKVADLFHVQVKEYTVAPFYDVATHQGKHEWIIELKSKNQLDELLFARKLDEELRQVNSDYDAKRSANLLLHNLSIRFVEEGTFEKWLRTHGKLGGQNKVPRLMNDRKVYDEVLAIC